MLTDGFSSLVTLAESDIDPAANNLLSRDCGGDMLTWYRNGGIASTIVDFWPGLMASGFEVEVSVARKRAGRSEAKATDQETALKNWLEDRYDQLDLLTVMKAAETQCQIAPAAPILVTYDKRIINKLTILDPVWTRRLRSPLNMFEILAYEITEPYRVTVPAEQVLALYSRKFNAQEWYQEYREYEWGYPLIDTNTMKMAEAYEMACHAGSILIQKKNFLELGIDGYLDGMAGANSEDYARRIMKMVRVIQKASNLLNVQIYDKSKMELGIIERNLTGVEGMIEQLRDMLLASCNNIPESRLFGRNRVGGISASNDDDERADSEATRLFNERWVPIIRRLNEFLLQEPGCPYKGGAPLITVGRLSSYQPKPLDVARARLTNIQADKILFEAGAIDTVALLERNS